MSLPRFSPPDLLARRTVVGALAFVVFTAGPALALAESFPWKARLDASTNAMLGRIAASSMRGHVSFLASDLLEGRATPSRGRDLAAEYVAAQFRRAGLEPGVGDSFFQEAPYTPRGTETPDKIRNVVGVLPGSDPKLRDTVVLVTAHYDHIGLRPGEGDTIHNGANDNASGTAGVIEIANALGSLPNRPRRTIVFIAFDGEERGLVGSRHYGKNPLFPIEKTVAAINLEQVGRTDDTEGARISEASMTGFDFSDVGAIYAEAGKTVGVKVTKHPRNSDAFFGRSDNQALADLGVPAHTVCTAFIYPDYHRPADHWDKLDYANMEKVVRMIALGTWMVAQTDRQPAWNASNPKAARYAAARKAASAVPEPR
ncbi:MAG: M28 family peptidase [Armatimonadaceae bacterium]